MKKSRIVLSLILVLLLVFVGSFVLTACGEKDGDNTQSDEQIDTPVTDGNDTLPSNPNENDNQKEEIPGGEITPPQEPEEELPGEPETPEEPSEDMGDSAGFLEFRLKDDYTYEVTFLLQNLLNNVIIPTYHNGVAVTSIGSSAFYGCDNITNVTIPNSVTSIGDGAFEHCDRLKSVTIPDSVTSIGDDAFAWCNSLTSITIGNSLTSIGNYAFVGCIKLVEIYNLSSLYITAGSSSNGHVGYYAKNVYTATEGESKLSTDSNGYIIYTNGEEKILVGYTGSETELTLPSGITAIYECSFYRNKTVTSVNIPDSVTSIGESAFYDCTSLTSVVIPNSVESIGEMAFYYCVKLVEVYNLSSLDITAGDSGYGYIGYYALDVYTSLDTPSKLTTDSNGYIIYTNGEEKILVGYTGDETELTLPNGITEIYQYAFYYNETITSVTISNSVTSIGDYAFALCISLSSVTIPNSVKSIGNDSFYFCFNLENLTIGNSVESIGEYAFFYCISIKSITIPSSVISIGEEAFIGCIKLVEIYNLSSLYITEGSMEHGFIGYFALDVYTSLDAHSKVSTDSNGYIIYTSKEEKILVGYTGDETKLTLPSGITEINKYALLNVNFTASNLVKCSNITSIVIPDSVTSIGDVAFGNCESLTTINYEGTSVAWNNISKGAYWNDGTGNYTINYNYKIEK